MKLYKVTAFAKTQEGGNPAGVVLESDGLTSSRMQEIARDVGFSETAFVMKSNKADFKVRFFTPTDEVDLCGHATIATFNTLRDLGIIHKSQYYQETKAGVLKITVLDNEVYMEQNLPQFGEIISLEEVLKCFYTDKGNFLHKSLPVQVVSTGLREILIPVKDLDTLRSLTPSKEDIKNISIKYNAIGIHAFTLESIDEASAHTRNFAPLVGIDEESATGTANGALACYLNKYLENSVTEYKMEQGFFMDKPSEIKVTLKVNQGKVTEVLVGGGSIFL